MSDFMSDPEWADGCEYGRRWVLRRAGFVEQVGRVAGLDGQGLLHPPDGYTALAAAVHGTSSLRPEVIAATMEELLDVPEPTHGELLGFVAQVSVMYRFHVWVNLMNDPI